LGRSLLKNRFNLEDYRATSILIGSLYILVIIAGILSIAPAVDKSTYLTKTALSSKRINFAAFAQLLIAVFYGGIALLFYPILEIFNANLAIGFLSFRFIAISFIVLGALVLLLILKLSQEYNNTNASKNLPYDLAGNMLRTGRDLINHVGMILMLCISNILLNLILIHSGLVPAWIPVWGLAGSTLSIVASYFVMIKYIEVVTPVYMVLNLPLAIQELIFAIWLIVKGFNSAV
jgi:hypothetical protein